MAKSKDINDPEGVSAFIQKVEPALAKQIEAVRQIILKTDDSIGEQIKWNAPAFFYKGAMKPFDPKEYKRDIVVMNIRKGKVLLVFPTGAVINDTDGLLEGDYPDGRRLVTFKDLNEVKNKAGQLQTVIQDWLSHIEK